MLIETVLGYKSTWRILELMAETHGIMFTRQELKEHTELGNESLTHALSRLVASGLVIKHSTKEIYQLNSTHPFFEIIITLVRKEYERFGAIGYKNKIILNEFTRKTLDQTTFIDKIILFGSLAKGTSTETSDIDIALIIKNENKNQQYKIQDIKNEIKKRYNKEIQTHYFTTKEYLTAKNELLTEIHKHGKDLLNPTRKWVLDDTKQFNIKVTKEPLTYAHF